MESHNTAGVSWSTARTQDHAQGGYARRAKAKVVCGGGEGSIKYVDEYGSEDPCDIA